MISLVQGLQFSYSRLRPTFPAFLKPNGPMAHAISIPPRLTQKVTLYPSMSACGESLFAKLECSVTEEEILAMTIRRFRSQHSSIKINSARVLRKLQDKRQR